MKKHILSVIAAVTVLFLSMSLIYASAYMLGNLDDDTEITSADARLALRAAVGLENLSEEALKAADVDFDDDVTSADARLILRAAVGLEELKDPHTHSFKETVTKAATCTNDGIKTFTCECGEDTYTEVIPKTGHSYEKLTTLPTCTAEGYTTHTCKNCNDSYQDNKVPATGHTPGADVTCTTAQVCTVCNTKLKDAVGHTPNANYTVTAKATCTENGTETLYCSKCTAVLGTKTIAKRTHNFVDNGVATKATCQSKGIMNTVCSNAETATHKKCTAVSTREIPVNAEAHSWKTVYTVDKKASCTEDGEKSYHCLYCNTVNASSKTVISKRSHSIVDTTVQKAATCTSAGVMNQKCNNAATSEYEACTYTTAREIAKDANNHSSTETKVTGAKEASCTEEGFSGDIYWTCCNTLKSEGTAISKLEHTYSELVEAKAVDRCIPGNVAYYTCLVCEKYFDETKTNELTKEDTVLAATAEHDFKGTDVAATCTEDAYYVEMCTVCSVHKEGTISYTENTRMGHSFVVTNTVPATCTEQGYNVKTCNRIITVDGEQVTCGVTENEFFGEVEGHDYKEIEGTKTEATCLVTGSVKVKCQRLGCGDETEQIIPLAPCTPSNSDETVAGNKEDGTVCKKVVRCTVCEKIVSEDTTQGHQYRDTITQRQSCVNEKIATRTCRLCGYVKENVVLEPASGHSIAASERVEPTCEVAGKVVLSGKCTNDGCDFETEEGESVEVKINPTGHKADEVSGGVATCTRAVYCVNTHKDPVTGEDVKCGAVIQEALGHDFNFFASAYSSDVTAFSCTRCGHIPADKETNINTFNTVANKIKGAVFSQTINKDNQIISIAKNTVDTKYSKFDFGIYTSAIKSMYEEEVENTPDDYSFRKINYVRSALPIINNYNTVSNLAASDIDSIKTEKLNNVNIGSVLSGFANSITVGKNTYDLTPYKNTTVTDVIKVTINVKNEAFTQVRNSEADTALEKITGIDIREDYTSGYDDNLQMKEEDSGVSMVMTLKEIKSDAVVTYYFDAETYEPIIAVYDVTVIMDQEIDMNIDIGIKLNGEMDPIITTNTSSAYLFPNYFN